MSDGRDLRALRARREGSAVSTPEESVHELTAEELAEVDSWVFTPEEIAAAEARDAAMIEVNSSDEIPAFANDEEAARWWGTHTAGPGLLRHFRPVPAEGTPEFPLPATPRRGRPPARQISLRLEWDTDRRLRLLAAKKGTKYQTLAKQFLQERLYEEEQREGLVG